MPPALVRQHLRRAAHRGRDHGDAGRHRFEDRDRHAFADRAARVDVGRGEQRADVRSVAGHVHRARRGRPAPLAPSRRSPLGTVADDQQSRGRHALAHRRERLEQRHQILDRIEPRHGGDDERPIVEAEQLLAARRSAVDGRGGRLDAVVHHAHPLARKARVDHVVAQLVRHGDDRCRRTATASGFTSRRFQRRRRVRQPAVLGVDDLQPPVPHRRDAPVDERRVLMAVQDVDLRARRQTARSRVRPPAGIPDGGAAPSPRCPAPGDRPPTRLRRRGSTRATPNSGASRRQISTTRCSVPPGVRLSTTCITLGARCDAGDAPAARGVSARLARTVLMPGAHEERRKSDVGAWMIRAADCQQRSDLFSKRTASFAAPQRPEVERSRVGKARRRRKGGRKSPAEQTSFCPAITAPAENCPLSPPFGVHVSPGARLRRGMSLAPVLSFRILSS